MRACARGLAGLAVPRRRALRACLSSRASAAGGAAVAPDTACMHAAAAVLLLRAARARARRCRHARRSSRCRWELALGAASSPAGACCRLAPLARALTVGAWCPLPNALQLTEEARCFKPSAPPSQSPAPPSQSPAQPSPGPATPPSPSSLTNPCLSTHQLGQLLVGPLSPQRSIKSRCRGGVGTGPKHTHGSAMPMPCLQLQAWRGLRVVVAVQQQHAVPTCPLVINKLHAQGGLQQAG